MTLKFRHLALLSAVLFVALAFIWMFVPERMLSNWGVAYADHAGLVSRRAAALYAGIGVMLFVARNAAPSVARTALTSGLVTLCLILAVLGLWEWSVGNAGNAILSVVVVEVALALAFLFAKDAKPNHLN